MTTPIIDNKKCTKCGLCVTDCVANAIHREKFEVISHKCILCGHCIAICPVEAVTYNGKTGSLITEISKSFASDFEMLVKRRRSVRQYIPKKIEPEIIDKICEITNHTPTGTNSRGVSISVINDITLMKEMSDIAMKHFRVIANLLLNPITYPFILPFTGIKKLKKLVGYKKTIHKYFEGENILTHNAPAFFAFHVDVKSTCAAEDGVLWASTAVLAAESLGLGTCYNGFLVRGINTNKKLKRMLKIPKGNRVYETFTTGYSAVKYKRTVEISKCKINIIEY